MGTDESQISRLVACYGREAVTYRREVPRHQVDVDSFYAAIHPVTNREYKVFVDATGHRAPFLDDPTCTPYNWVDRMYPHDKEDHPVVLITWEDAAAYCRWVGVRLPTEAEWEWMARGPDERTFPWGSIWDAALAVVETDGTRPVGTRPSGASPFGLLDLAGNVWEFAADWFDPTYYHRSPARNPTGPDSGELHVCRGGSWRDVGAGNLRVTYRTVVAPEHVNHCNVGFRYVVSETDWHLPRRGG
jgi:serine/threonine-protein kinase